MPPSWPQHSSKIGNAPSSAGECGAIDLDRAADGELILRLGNFPFPFCRNDQPRKVANMADPVPSVPLLDINRDNQAYREEFVEALSGVLDSGRFLFGPDVVDLEQEVAAYSQADHAVGCASGSDALLLALMALGIGPGDEVIVPSFTFFASVSCITRVGATPVFVDIRGDTFNMDAEKIESLISD